MVGKTSRKAKMETFTPMLSTQANEARNVGDTSKKTLSRLWTNRNPLSAHVVCTLWLCWGTSEPSFGWRLLEVSVTAKHVSGLKSSKTQTLAYRPLATKPNLGSEAPNGGLRLSYYVYPHFHRA